MQAGQERRRQSEDSRLAGLVRAALRIGARAVSRPAADEVQVRRQAPASDRLEHVVIEHEFAGISPVVGDLPGVVVAHDIGRASGPADRWRRVAGGAPAAGPLFGRPDEAVHLAAMDVRYGVHETMGGTAIHEAGIVVRPVTTLSARIWHANRKVAVPIRDSVRARIGSEERIEGPVLLHDDDDVPDLADSLRDHVGPGGRRSGRPDRIAPVRPVRGSRAAHQAGSCGQHREPGGSPCQARAANAHARLATSSPTALRLPV
jgi:hypothetical protein